MKAKKTKKLRAAIILRNKKQINDTSAQVLQNLRKSQNKQPVLKLVRRKKKQNVSKAVDDGKKADGTANQGAIKKSGDQNDDPNAGDNA